MADELLRNQVECGAIREELGNPAKGGFGRTPSNALYGVTEAPLIFDNGDPVCDMLYTTNFAFVGLYEAAAATGDPKYWDAVRRMGDFLVRIQVSSKEFENVDGAWFRAFDYEDWDYWASNADAGEPGAPSPAGFRVGLWALWPVNSRNRASGSSSIPNNSKHHFLPI